MVPPPPPTVEELTRWMTERGLCPGDQLRKWVPKDFFRSEEGISRIGKGYCPVSLLDAMAAVHNREQHALNGNIERKNGPGTKPYRSDHGLSVTDVNSAHLGPDFGQPPYRALEQAEAELAGNMPVNDSRLTPCELS